MLKKVLKYNIVDVDDEVVLIKITEQSHRENNFGNIPVPKTEPFPGCNSIAFSDKKSSLLLCSVSRPKFDTFRNILYVRGRMSSADNDVISIPILHFPAVKNLIAAYNKYAWDETINVAVRDDVFGEIKERIVTNIEQIYRLLARMQKAKSRKEFLALKGSILRTLCDMFPLGGSMCYDCIELKMACEKCEFGAEFGVCTDYGDSLYKETEVAHTTLEMVINKWPNTLEEEGEV